MQRFFYSEPLIGKNKIVISYDSIRQENYGEIKKLTLKGYNKNTKYVTEALNYMDEQGYELFSSMSSMAPFGFIEKYVFRREIKK